MPVVVHAGPEGMTSPLRLIEGRILGTYPHDLLKLQKRALNVCA
jgi:hypothetical protein